MADYRLPMDADGVKYHGTVDQNEENPGQFMYGLDENGNKRIIRTDEQGNVLTRVTGSNVEVVKIFDGLAINDTNIHHMTVDLSDYKYGYFLARSTLDKYPTIQYRIPSSASPVRVYRDGAWVRPNDVIIEDSLNRTFLLNTYWPELEKMPLDKFYARVSCTEAPSSGSFTLEFWGVK